MAAVTLLQKWQLLQVIFADADLSATAKLVAARLLYHHSAQTGRCSPSYQTIADGVALKRRAVIYAVQELEAGGWLVLTRVKGGDPAAAQGFVTNGFIVNFSRADDAPPVHADALPPGAPSDTPPGASPCTPPGAREYTPPGAPTCTPGVHADALPPVHGGAPNSGKDTGKGNREESPPTPSRFDQFWDHYPRKVGKDDAQKAFDHVIRDSKATPEELIAGAERFAIERAGEPSKFTPYPATWIRRGQWADEPVQTGNPHNAGSAQWTRRDSNPTSAREYMIERRARRMDRG